MDFFSNLFQSSASIEDDILNNPPEEQKDDVIKASKNLKDRFAKARKVELAEQLDNDEQMLFKSFFTPVQTIIDVKLPLTDDEKISRDQVRLIQLANANFRQELGKYNNIPDSQEQNKNPDLSSLIEILNTQNE